MELEEENKPRVQQRRVRKEKTEGGKVGAPKGNRNAAKVGEDLRFEMYLSKTRRGFFEEWFVLKFGRPPLGEDELREAARQIASIAIDRAIIEEFERQPGRINQSGGEVF